MIKKIIFTEKICGSSKEAAHNDPEPKHWEKRRIILKNLNNCSFIISNPINLVFN